MMAAIERLGLLKLLPGRLGRLAPLLPPPTRPGPRLPKFLPAVGRKRARVAFFVGCVADAMFRPVHWATVRVLQQNGCDVFVPRGQGCCGAIHLHNGDPLGARRLADANLVAFELDRYDAILVNHGGCGAMLKEYGLHWHDGLQPHRARFAEKVKDVHEFLDTLGIVPFSGRIEAVATYHDSCHLAHAQRVAAAPRRLLAKIPGLDLRELPEAGICCGAAGTYNLTEPRDVRPALAPQAGQHPQHRRPDRARRQRRLPAADSARSPAGGACDPGDASHGTDGPELSRAGVERRSRCEQNKNWRPRMKHGWNTDKPMLIAAPHPEIRIILSNISWATYEALVAENDSPGKRVVYDQGTLEIMSPSAEHERYHRLLGRLVEAFTLERNIPIRSTGADDLEGPANGARH